MEIRVAGEASRPAEPAEFGQFYAAHFQRIAKQLHAYLGDAEESQDLTQEAFCRALDRWERIQAFDDAAAWVRRVAWNLATSSLRRRATALRYLSRHREESVPGPQPDGVALAGALASLPPRQRRAVVLHHVAQLSTAEIAAQEGVAEGTVRSWLSRGRTALAQRLADDETEFRPAPLAVVQDVVRRRRRARVVTLTAIILLVLVVPALVSLTRVPPAPVIAPTPTVSPTPAPTVTTSPAPTFETRRIVVPGYPATTDWGVDFLDADHAWAWDRDAFALAATADGGRTWHLVDVPVPNTTFWLSGDLYATDSDTVTVVVRDDETLRIDSFLLTTDGGVSFSTYPPDAPPLQAQRVASRIFSGNEHYALLCPGKTVFPDVTGGTPECEKQQLIRVGSGPVNPQPPVGGSPWYMSELREGGDGRLWIFSNDLALPALQVSTDGARSWQEVAAPGGVIQNLLISPDGADVWLVMANEEVYLLRDGTWQRQHPDFRHLGRATYTPIDGGILLIPGPGGLNAYQDAAMHPLPGSPPGILTVEQLADGTLVAGNAERMFLGTGEGLERTWIEILRSGQS